MFRVNDLSIHCNQYGIGVVICSKKLFDFLAKLCMVLLYKSTNLYVKEFRFISLVNIEDL